MVLMHRLSTRGFPWTECRLHTLIFWATAAALILMIASQAIAAGGYGMPNPWWPWNAESLSAKLIRALVQCFNAIVFTVFLSHIWVVSILVHLHRHDLFCYASALARALEVPEPDSNMPAALEKLELAVTTRFRYANSSWVPLLVYVATVMGTILLVVTSLLLTRSKSLQYPAVWL